MGPRPVLYYLMSSLMKHTRVTSRQSDDGTDEAAKQERGNKGEEDKLKGH
jgi:hypothetical protein